MYAQGFVNFWAYRLAAIDGVILCRIGRYEVIAVVRPYGRGGPTYSALLDLVLHAEALALDGHCLSVMEEAVEQGGGERSVVVEDLGPFLEHAVGGDEGGAALVALADDLEQEIGAILVDGEIAELIEDPSPAIPEAGTIATAAESITSRRSMKNPTLVIAIRLSSYP